MRKKWETAGLILLAVLILALLPSSPRVMEVTGVWPSPGIIYKGDEGVVLTFNVTIGDDSVLWLAEELQRTGIEKATFFLDPSWVDRKKKIADQLKAYGYDIGIYDLHPARYEGLSEKEMDEHIAELVAFFHEHELSPDYYRTADGLLNEEVVRRLREQDLLVVSHEVTGEALLEGEHQSYNGAVVSLDVVNDEKELKQRWTEWRSALERTDDLRYVSVLELLASSDSKIKLLE
ncbi:polysaccharide deacetylase family protein [Jeotgalibacillus sp. R-1-5s-1]|uniref:polysaccharide deacetylase family protein n=1 Tax=Jeotgalibacillus sp. R-1-5s-1 TaxID=2555897 RepID=UPI0010691D35|nr:polysaccharide deacetylase family protein [Jeotgalibacillus sp. R-1-5s-1]TFD99396.1 hypothetical protein E2491_08030 [Jeotgalibacillus sp. R-1-5s-1]